MEVKAGYRQTEAGVIPEDWDYDLIKNIAAVTKLAGFEFTSTIKYCDDGEIIAIRALNIKNGRLDLSEIQRIKKDASNQLPRSKINSGDILITYIGANIGDVLLIEESDKFHLAPNVAKITPSNRIVDKFLEFVLKTNFTRKQYQKLTVITATPSLTMTQIRSIIVPLPPPPEQRAIATALADVDALITSLDKLIAKKRDIKQAAMQEFLAGRRRLPGFCGEWEVKPLGDVAEVIMGQSPPGSTYNQRDDGTPLINGPTEFTEKTPIKIQWTTQPTKICQDGDLLLCVRGSSTGRMNVSNDKYCIGRGVAAIRAKPGFDTTFLTFLIFSAIQNLLSFSAGSTFPNVDGKSIRSISILIPPLPEQVAIATILSDMDADLAALEQKRDKTKAIKQGMMQELLSGRIRLV